ncbi:MAG TPA: 2OG-Fe(II) oxygenase [Sphingomicrobium sp.]
MSEVEQAHQLVAAGQPRRGAELLGRAAARGDDEAALELAIWLLEGRLVPRDLAAAREQFRHAGELGSIPGLNVHIAFLANGIGGAADWSAALELLRDLGMRDPLAERQLALIEAMDLPPEGYPASPPQGQQLSDRPQARTFERLLSNEECAYVIERARPLLQPSVIVDPSTGQMRPHPVRTSEGAAFPWASEDLVISAINRRIAAASGTDVVQGEPLQVLRYWPGQEYRPHFDALPTGENQRIVTVLVYLNDGYKGGETEFTRTGVRFAGRTGDALLFRNALADGAPDDMSQHAGLPVRSGEKLIATRWIRERRFGPS